MQSQLSGICGPEHNVEFVASTPNFGAYVGSQPIGISVAAPATPVGRTVLMIENVANISAIIKEVGVFFTGVTATNSPVLVELIKSTLASNATAGAAVTPVQWRGQGNTTGAGLTSQITAYAGFVTEPTVATALESWLVPPTTGVIVPMPLGDEPELIAGAATMGIGIRVTPTQAVSVIAYIRFQQGLS